MPSTEVWGAGRPKEMRLEEACGLVQTRKSHPAFKFPQLEQD
jgi:hypothetical protein